MTVRPSSKLHRLKKQTLFQGFDAASEVSFYLFLWRQWLEEEEVIPKVASGGLPGVLDRFLWGPLYNSERFHVSILSFTGGINCRAIQSVRNVFFSLYFSEPAESHEYLLHIIPNNPNPARLLPGCV